MLEFKNTSVRCAEGRLSSPFSLIVEPGEVVCVNGPAGSGKSRLLLAVMGLAPVEQGFITLDGELITSGAGSYFRRMMAYVPQELPRNPITVGDLFDMIVTGDQAQVKEAFLSELKVLGMDKAVLEKKLCDMADLDYRLLLLCVALVQRRPIVLIDDLPQVMQADRLVHSLASNGAEVIYTCRENKLNCQKTINL